jgi:methyl-accepting chemotaxis protein
MKISGSFFDRIQGRLMAVFGIAMIGAGGMWFMSFYSLRHFADQVQAQLDSLAIRSSIALALEAAIADQSAAVQGFLITGDPQRFEELRQHATRADSMIVHYGAAAGSSIEDRDRLARLQRVQRGLADQLPGGSRDGANGDVAAAHLPAGAIETMEAALREMRIANRGLNQVETRRIAAMPVAVAAAAEKTQQQLGILMLLTALFTGAFVLRTMRAVERPLQRLVGAADQFGAGDLTVKVDGRMPEEFRVLAGAFTGMAGRMRTIVGETVTTASSLGVSASELSASSEEVATATGEVSSAMVHIAAGAEQQAQGIRAVEEALQEMRDRASEIDGTADGVRERMRQVRSLAETRRHDIGLAVASLLELREVVQQSGDDVAQLQRGSDRIASFAGTIQGIARQTNLLALNAAIEAARAGEQGRGFAVVADEVRKLADGSARAADEVTDAVHLIRQQIDTVVATMERGSARVAGVEDTARGADAAFEEIIGSVQQVSESVARMAAAAAANVRVLGGVEENVRAVGTTAAAHAEHAQDVSALAEEQSAATEQMMDASLELLRVADRLRELVSGFRV